MIDDFLNPNYNKPLLLEFIIEFFSSVNYFESLLLGYCNESCDNLQ